MDKLERLSLECTTNLVLFWQGQSRTHFGASLNGQEGLYLQNFIFFVTYPISQSVCPWQAFPS
jgi:hypothetical protein